MNDDRPGLRKEGQKFRTLRRIYKDKAEGYGRTLLYAAGKLISAAEVKLHNLEHLVEQKTKPVKPKKDKE